MKYWLARFVLFVAIVLIRLAGLLGVFKTWFGDVLVDDGYLIDLHRMLKKHTNQFVKDFFLSIKARMPWNR